MFIKIQYCSITGEDSACLPYWHPIQIPVQDIAAPLLFQLLTNVSGKLEKMAQVLGSLSPSGRHV